jgi:hypothetical protein
MVGVGEDPPFRRRRLVITPAPDAILTRSEVAAWLKVKPRQVERLGIPCLDLGRKTKRYLGEDVLAWLDAQRQVPSHSPQRLGR